jgi:hypothetical protein
MKGIKGKTRISTAILLALFLLISANSAIAATASGAQRERSV